MLAVHHPDQLLHRPIRSFRFGRPAPHPDRLWRHRLLLKALRDGGHELVIAPDAGMGPLLAVHDPAFLHFLETAWNRWQETPYAGQEEIVATMHPTHRMQSDGDSVLAELGRFSTDASCPIGPGTWRAVRASAMTSVHAADRVIAGARCVYALCRPPGHHAFRDATSGICYLNVGAIAAERLRSRFSRVAILDIDVHHGNGTQAIFWERDDVVTVSCHVEPRFHAPYFTGWSDERGAGHGLGANANFTMSAGSDDDVFLTTLDEALAFLRAAKPNALVVEVGFDGLKDDLFKVMRISEHGFVAAAKRIAGLAVPSVLVQSGGYAREPLASVLSAFLDAFEAHHDC